MGPGGGAKAAAAEESNASCSPKPPNSSWPQLAAQISAVCPFPAAASGSVPAASSTRTSVACPFLAAYLSASSFFHAGLPLASPALAWSSSLSAS